MAASIDRELERAPGASSPAMLRAGHRPATEPTVLAEGELRALAEHRRSATFVDLDGERGRCSPSTRCELLSIRRGSLTSEERREIESHVTHTYRFL